MTPPATATASGHRTGLRRGPVPRTPRRVSGPASQPRAGRAAPAAGAAALPGAQRSRAPWTGTLGARALRGLVGLADHPLLDRLLRGRTWLALVTFALIGIVFMQVSLLKINSSIGRAVETATRLERENSTLDAIASRLASPERLQQVARRMGMVMPAGDQLTFLGTGGRRVAGSAAAAIGAGSTAAMLGSSAAGVGATAGAAATIGSTATSATTATSGSSATTYRYGYRSAYPSSTYPGASTYRSTPSAYSSAGTATSGSTGAASTSTAVTSASGGSSTAGYAYGSHPTTSSSYGSAPGGRG